ncbi:HTH domain-containing protein [Lactobacillus sp. LL6]|uniref:BglG family transcription antiterminator n=1 Tax=Lactobacillus sp. LL6 TaxID=2596827 RepID=UPI0011847793|nr:HTH domain-containing protein [Lactobacillus sp. LL6]TSO26064.1 HTH domain-containing protein [Lactobacillus sp. LL6]
MILTQRQKDILLLFLTNREVSVKEIEKRANISRRTVYREFNELRPILAQEKLELASKKRNYTLVGDKKSLKKLQTLLKTTKSQVILDIEQRKNALVSKLLLADQPQKIINLAMDLQVSEATIQNDLNTIEGILNEYKITLLRKPGVGVAIKSLESQRRQVLVGILLNEINDYDFFHYLSKTERMANNFFLQLFPKNLLLTVKNLLEETVFPSISLDSDHQIIELILSFVVSIMRIKQGFSIENIKPTVDSLKYQGLVFKFMAKFAAKTDLNIEQTDIIYLANKIMACDNTQIDFSYDSDYKITTSIKVKKFVEIVSEQVHWNFQKNPNFIKRLNHHIMSLINHQVVSLPNTKIETLVGLSKKFKKLYIAIENAWNKEFIENKITKSEMQLLLLYFANEYTSAKNNQQINALVICENGIGTSAILRARLKQELPEIKNIDLSKVADLANENLQKYDLILSTLELKGFSRKYLLVSPLLLNDEINRIKNYLKEYERKFPIVENKRKKQDFTHSTEKLVKISIGTLFCTELVNNIKVTKLKNNSTDLIAVVQECLAHTKGVIRRQQPIAKKILKRIRLAPVGIPNSQLALLHTSDKHVKKCTFLLFDLDNKLTMKSMDHAEIQVKRVLLMLGPAKMSSLEQEVMSMISSMIIMNDENLQLFTEGNQAEIKDAVSAQYLYELNNKI